MKMKPKLTSVEVGKCKHPNSRKTKVLAKLIKRQSNKEKTRNGTQIKRNLIGEKFLWFKNHLDENRTYSRCVEVEQLIEQYLHRFDDELEQIKLKHLIGQRKNRQHANREDIIEMTIKKEIEEFNTCGIEIPDIPNELNMLKNWNGELRFLQNFKIVRYKKQILN